jgi:hypothetical protein
MYHVIAGWAKGLQPPRLLRGGFCAAVVPNGSIPTKELSYENLGLRFAQKWTVKCKREEKELDIISTQLHLRQMTSLQSELTETNNTSHVITTYLKFLLIFS